MKMSSNRLSCHNDLLTPSRRTSHCGMQPSVATHVRVTWHKDEVQRRRRKESIPVDYSCSTSSYPRPHPCSTGGWPTNWPASNLKPAVPSRTRRRQSPVKAMTRIDLSLRSRRNLSVPSAWWFSEIPYRPTVGIDIVTAVWLSGSGMYM